MKNRIVICVALVLSAFMVGSFFCSNVDEYSRDAEVESIQGDTVYFEDTTGNVWAWEGAEDCEVGDQVAMIMDDCGTENINDDKIVRLN